MASDVPTAILVREFPVADYAQELDGEDPLFAAERLRHLVDHSQFGRHSLADEYNRQ